MNTKRRISPPGRRLRQALILAPALALVLGLALSVHAAQFTASLDRDSVVVGETVTLTLSFEGAAPQEVSGLPTIDGLQVASGFQFSSRSTLGPSGATSVQSYSVLLVPQRTGEFVIPSFQARVNGAILTSQPVRLKVAASDPTSPPAELASKPAFLLAMPPKKELFVGQTVIAEVRLYVRGEFHRYQDLQLPLVGDGFTFSPLINGQPYQRRVGPSPFTVIPLYFALTPVKAGTLTVGPLNGSVVLMSGDAFFFGPRPAQVPLVLGTLTFQVSPLPSRNVPPDFNGAVGNFTMSVSAGPTNVAVGDPVTVRIRIAGEGHLDALTLPEQTAWHDLKTYPPTATLEAQSPLNVEGTKTFEQVVVIPQNTDIKVLPPVSFSYFDPDQKSYRTLKDGATPLIIRPGGSTLVPATAAHAADTSGPARDIVPIKQRSGALSRLGPPLARRGWFLTLQGVPALALISAVAWRRRNESLANNPRRRRQQQVDRIVHDGLNDLRTFAAENKSDEFFATLFRLLQEQLGERLDLPASAITEAVIEEQLQPGGAPEGTLAGLRELFLACNLARYAPVQSSQELAALTAQAETVLGELRELAL